MRRRIEQWRQAYAAAYTPRCYCIRQSRCRPRYSSGLANTMRLPRFGDSCKKSANRHRSGSVSSYRRAAAENRRIGNCCLIRMEQKADEHAPSRPPFLYSHFLVMFGICSSLPLALTTFVNLLPACMSVLGHPIGAAVSASDMVSIRPCACHSSHHRQIGSGLNSIHLIPLNFENTTLP